EAGDPPVAVLDETGRKPKSWFHEAIAVGHEEELLGLESLGHRHGDVVAGQVLRLAGRVPSDTGEDRDHPLIKNLLKRLLENFLNAAGILEVHSIDHTDSAGANEITDDGVGLESSQ